MNLQVTKRTHCATCGAPSIIKLCPRCEKQLATWAQANSKHKDPEESETTMAKKNTSKKNASTTVEGAVESETAVVFPEVVGNADGLSDSYPHDEEERDVEIEAALADEDPSGDAEMDEVESASVKAAAPQLEKVPLARHSNAMVASLSIRAALIRLKRIQWAAVGANEVPGLLEGLAHVADRLSAKTKKGGARAKELAPGDRVSIRDKFKAEYVDMLSIDDLTSLRITKVRGKVAELKSDELPKLFIRVSQLEKML